MKKILIIGAGRSSDFLIDYLASHSPASGYSLTVADADVQLVKKKCVRYPHVRMAQINVNQTERTAELIREQDVVISMLPALMHPEIAKICVQFGKHLFTASYVSKALRELEHDINAKGLLFFNECGLDPGIDHMSAMKIIKELKLRGGRITGFLSWCGGLVAESSNDNPWGYKFSWNPRNVVLAGKGTAIYRSDGQTIFKPYHRLFLEHFTLKTDESGIFDAYPNRDSLSYEKVYGLEGIPTLIRGTLRYPGYCKAWHVLVDIGLTDENAILSVGDTYTLHHLARQCLALSPESDLRDFIKKKYENFWNDDIEKKLEYIGLFKNEPLPREAESLADALQAVLEKKWKLKDNDKDRVVMAHEFYYELNGKKFKYISWLDLEGESNSRTAMAKTVGLPLAVAVRLFAENKITDKGIVIPVEEKWYRPILKELEAHDITFKEKEELVF
ncbi:MAG: saccharopine dehydrogenase NADP-binding domain-containing protein [Bacteroidia bacterium]|nr:saccharopine dehydrogenase NADP-binding domain-containing protein [Bacteroidia bacterium]